MSRLSDKLRANMVKEKTIGENLREAIALMQKNNAAHLKEGMSREDMQEITKMQKNIIQKIALIQNHKFKKHGIPPGSLLRKHINYNFEIYEKKAKEKFKSDSVESFNKEDHEWKLPDQSLSELIVISQDNKLYMVWSSLHVLSCLISPYFYAYYATFTDTANDCNAHYIDVAFEIQFTISFILRFFVEYNEDEYSIPVRTF